MLELLSEMLGLVATPQCILVTCQPKITVRAGLNNMHAR